MTQIETRQAAAMPGAGAPQRFTVSHLEEGSFEAGLRR